MEWGGFFKEGADWETSERCLGDRAVFGKILEVG